jgi:VanZ family protein
VSLRVWPAVLLAAAILATSGPWASADRTSSLTSSWLVALGFSEEIAVLLHGIVRKSGHLFAYALFAMLAWRAVGDAVPVPRRATVALLASVALACADEALQSRFAARGGSAWDVLLDSAGAVIAIALAARVAVRRASRQLR